MSLGSNGEELAAKYLENKGYEVIAKNYRKSFGEIDLIVKKNKTLVFVEVKTRMNMNYGLPREAITLKKLKAIEKVAEFYISLNKLKNLDFQIDLVEILFVKGKPYVCHTENISM